MEQEKRFCKICGKEMAKVNDKYCSRICFYKSLRKKTPEEARWEVNGYISYKDWVKSLEYFNNSCAYCGDSQTKLQQEHFIAKNQRGEIYEKDNIIPACPTCNRRKYNENVLGWYKRQSFFSKERFSKILRYLGYI